MDKSDHHGHGTRPNGTSGSSRVRGSSGSTSNNDLKVQDHTGAVTEKEKIKDSGT